jgi:hypothetical protein
VTVIGCTPIFTLKGIAMKTRYSEKQITAGMEEILKFVCSLIIIATPVCGIWSLNAMPLIAVI